MSSKKKEIIKEVGEELGVNITRQDPLKKEWREILGAIRVMKYDE